VKKILGLSIAIVLIIGLVAGGTWAYFSDTETSTGNTFSAGTVDIAVDGENPWTKSFTVKDIEPCYTGYINFTVNNVGTSDVVVWKQLVVTAQGPGTTPESELAEDPSDTLNNLASWTFYDLYSSKVGWIIPAANKVRVDNVNNCWIKLGTLTSGQSMDVEQSYHLRPETTNWAQGDIMTFTITLMAAQTNDPGASPVATSGVATLENKDTYWSPITDTISGTVNYTYAGTTLSGTFTATGLATSTSYDLIYYADPWPGTGGCILVGGVVSDGSGNITSTAFSGSPVPSGTDTNLPVGIKVWLVPTGEFVPGTPATWPHGWNPSSYLFETNLINLPQ